MRSLVILFLAVVCVFSQPSYMRRDTFEPDLLEKRVKALCVVDTLIRQFQQTRTLRALDRNMSSSGTIIITADGVIMETTEPRYNYTHVSNAGVYTKSKPEGALKKSRSENHFGPLFASLFSGNMQKLRDRFYVQYSETSEGWTMHLYLKEEELSRAIEGVTLKGDEELELLRLVISNADTIELRFFKGSTSEK